MNPGDYPSPNSPIFGGGARWSGTDPDKYQPFHSNTQYDPDFSTDSYGLSDMEPSPTRAPAPPRRAAAAVATHSAAANASGSATKKKRTRQRTQKLPLSEKNEEFASARTNYNLDETEVLMRC